MFVIVVVVMLRQPSAAVGALMCTYGLQQWAQSQSTYFFLNRGATNNLTAMALVAALGLRVMKGRSILQPLTREFWVMIALYTMAVMSIAWSVSPSDTIEQLFGNYKSLLVFAFLMPLAITDIRDLKASLYTLLTLGFALCLLLLLTSQWSDRQVVAKVGSVFVEEGLLRGNPLAIANLGGEVALVAMLMNFRGAARFWQVFRYAVIGVGFALSVRTGSRGQTFAVAICALAFLPYSRRFKDIKGFLGLAITLMLVGGLMLVLFDKVTADVHSSEDRWSWDLFVRDYQGARVGQAMILLEAWAAGGPLRWLIGLGSSASFDPGIIGFYPHVVFLEVLGELGVVGWILLWLVPIFVYQNLRELWTYVKDDAEERGVVATLGGLMLFEIIMSFKQGSLLGSGSAFAFSFIIGRITWSYRHEIVRLAQLDAGGYEMSPADWDDQEEFEPQAEGHPGLAMGRH